MKRKLTAIVAAVLITVIFLPSATSAYYSNVIGEARDSKTGDPWVHGGLVEVFHCSTLANIASDSLDGNGEFDISLPSPSADQPLCVEITFEDGDNGTPGNASKGPFANRSGSTGTLDTGVYFTGTGPTSVTVSHAVTQNAADRVPLKSAGVSGALVILLGAVTWVTARRRR